MLNKKACRGYAGLRLNISPDNPLLHDPAVKYIVRTAIRIVDRQKILIMYFYPREQAAHGDFRPLWVMFHGRDDYITLAREEDGGLKWRTSALERLSREWNFPASCSLLSQADQQNISRYCGNTACVGLYPVLLAPNRFLEKRKQERLRAQDRGVKARMACLPALPRNWKTWVRRTALPAYFFYDYRKGQEAIQGVCTSCGHTAEISGAKYNAKGTCPRCGHEVIMKSRGRRGHIYDRGTAQILQRTAPDEIVIRIIKAESIYNGDTAREYIKENARIFIRFDGEKTTSREEFYLDYSDSRWKPGSRPVYYSYCYSYAADICGHLYCGNLRRTLAGTPWQYCPLELFYRHFREPMGVIPFLSAYLRHPRLEHLIKVGFWSLADDVIYRGSSGLLDETQARTHRILNVDAGDVDFLRSLDIDASGLRTFQDYCKENLKDRHRLLAWQREHDVRRDLSQPLEHMSVHRLVRYMNEQYALLSPRRSPSGQRRYGSMQDLVSEYRDYLEMCEREKHDMASSFVLYPKDLQKSHDRLVHHIKVKADARVRRRFKAAYAKAVGTLDFEYKGLKIVYPAKPDDVVNEGSSLHHCVGSYVDRIANKKCLILFLRRSADQQKPFYTIELRDGQVTQVSGKVNAAPTPEVESFIRRWERTVLQRPAQEAA
ncbi:MAG: PcfJ domain-containing protein [Oscillospiraceae bacterium]|nr:PcfJ domain-containing protein [Oscillospiraceae bacterium]